MIVRFAQGVFEKSPLNFRRACRRKSHPQNPRSKFRCAQRRVAQGVFGKSPLNFRRTCRRKSHPQNLRSRFRCAQHSEGSEGPLERLRRSYESRRRAARGFSLLEVLVAVAVMAMGVTALFTAQGQSIRLAQEAGALTVATQLSRAKLYDCETELLKRGFSEGDYKESGKFDEEGYENFFWECHAYEPDLPVPEAGTVNAEAMEALAGQGGGGGAAAQNPIAGALGGQMVSGISGAVSQLAQIMKDSLREVVVVVKWKDGNAWEEMRTGMHIVDTRAVAAFAKATKAQTDQLQGMLGNLTGGNNGGPSSQPTPPPPPPRGRR